MLNYNTLPLSCHGQITLSNSDEICPKAIPNQISFISMHVPSWLKFFNIYSSYRLENGNMGESRAGNSVKM